MLNGKGASLLDGYMEDLATDRIYRLMIAQRIRHRVAAELTDAAGDAAIHTAEFVSKLFDQELERILRDLPAATNEADVGKYREARRISELLIRNEEFDPI